MLVSAKMPDTDSGLDRPSSAASDDINIEFPTELIPDEYEHENGTNGLVYMFQDSGNVADTLLDSLKHSGYNVPPENIFSIKDISAVIEELTKLADNDFTEKTCLLVVFIANTNIFKGLFTKEVWSSFINNTTLKYKPKIFMFYEYQYEEKNIITTDSIKPFAKDELYDVPSEADVLIVYQKSVVPKKNPHGFLGPFSEHLKNYGERDDIMGLLIRTQHAPRPLVISTLRKKFYITSSTTRDHYFDIQSNSEKVLNIINSLKVRMQKIGSDSPKRTLLSNSISVDKSTNKPAQSPQKLKKNLTVTDSLSDRRISSSSASMASTKGSKPDRPRWRN